LPVPVWALGIFYFVSDVQGAASGGGQVANVAHLAGAVFGLCYAWRGWDLESLFDISNRVKQMRRRMRVVHPEDDFENGRGAGQSSKNRTVQSREETAEQQAVDTILEKISRSGESSLTAQERDTLTRASQRLKDRMR